MALRPGLHGAKAWLKVLDRYMLECINNVADELESKAKEVCPERTGTLKAGYKAVHATRVGERAGLTNEVEYHDYVNDGTEDQRGQHMVETAISSISPNALSYIKRGGLR